MGYFPPFELLKVSLFHKKKESAEKLRDSCVKNKKKKSYLQPSMILKVKYKKEMFDLNKTETWQSIK